MKSLLEHLQLEHLLKRMTVSSLSLSNSPHIFLFPEGQRILERHIEENNNSPYLHQPEITSVNFQYVSLES